VVCFVFVFGGFFVGFWSFFGRLFVLFFGSYFRVLFGAF
jgi:hypothetical protein